MLRELCKETLLQGGDISPVVIPAGHTGGTTLMNPSVFVWDGRIIVNVRHVNYVLYHCEGNELFYHRWGPLVYVHPENDVTLTTTNYIAFYHDNLEMTGFAKVDTSKLDTKPKWDFIGLEDGRLVKWDGKLFLSGVRRDTKEGGEGRMELSELITKNCNMYEVSRMRIEIPEGETSYCEKNWMPILDMPYHYIKWCNPTQVVKVDPMTGKSTEVYKCKYTIPGLPDFRGSSQVITWKGYHMAIIHQAYLFNNQLGQKDGDYSHRLLVWDKDWDLIHVGDPFKFMTGSIEFCCGMDLFGEDLLISFGFQDNASYLLRIPGDKIESMFNLKYLDFKWGIFKKDPEFFYNVRQELFERDIYQMLFSVEPGDVVVDIGASCGPFTRVALDKNPLHVYTLEPNKELSVTIEENFSNNKNVTIINKGIASVDGPFIFENVYEPLTNHKFWEKANGEGITLKTLIKDYKVDVIDFLKIDCEGGEYDFFNDENLGWILKHVKKIAAEIHLLDEPMMRKYVKFRDTYLRKFTNYTAYTYDGSHNITSRLFTDEFAVTPRYFMLYIDNR
jgi:FkbM family methyltransferase